MSVNSSLQQIAGGIASVLAGLIIIQDTNGKLKNFDVLGYVVITIMVICGILMWYINRQVARKLKAVPTAQEPLTSEVPV